MFDFDLATQQSLDVFNFSDTQVSFVDEIRVGTTFEAVMGGGGGGDHPLGDYNASGQVEQGDLDLVLLNWGEPHDPAPDGWTNDLPTAPAINQDELDGVLLNWGNTATSSRGRGARAELDSGARPGGSRIRLVATSQVERLTAIAAKSRHY